jgi:hypothetical protein
VFSRQQTLNSELVMVVCLYGLKKLIKTLRMAYKKALAPYLFLFGEAYGWQWPHTFCFLPIISNGGETQASEENVTEIG